MKWIALCTLLGVAIIGLAGCKESGPRTTSYMVGNPGGERMRVAVLPFDNASRQGDDSAQIVSQELVTVLLGTGMFDVVDPGAVYAGMVDAGLRNGNGFGLAPVALQKLQDKVGTVDVFVAGIVQEFGEVRVGPANYPSISISARLLDARTGSILWAGSVSRTGADSEKFFGFGAVHSTGRLARAAVRDLISTVDCAKLAQVVSASNGESHEGQVLEVSSGMSHQTVSARSAASQTSPASPRRTGNERYLDESANYPEAALRDMLVEVTGLTRGPVEYREHHYSIVEATYDGRETDIYARVVDYRKTEAALGFVRHQHPDETETTFVGLPAFSGESSPTKPGMYHLDVAAGRFGVFVHGPASRRTEVERVTTAIVRGME